MSTKDNKELIRRFNKDFNELVPDMAKIRAFGDKYFAPGYVLHDTLGDQNKEQAMQFFFGVWSACPDFNYSLDDMVAESDAVAIRFTMRFTHTGTFMGVPATGKKVAFSAVQINKVLNGQISETWQLADNLGLMTQLGVVPAAPKK